jgi:predicted HAD superfamily Cof-like phosphohydrolase
MSAGWETVIRSNMAKVDPETGRVRRRADGKILKPDGWEAPQEELARLIRISDFLD